MLQVLFACTQQVPYCWPCLWVWLQHGCDQGPQLLRHMLWQGVVGAALDVLAQHIQALVLLRVVQQWVAESDVSCGWHAQQEVSAVRVGKVQGHVRVEEQLA